MTFCRSKRTLFLPLLAALVSGMPAVGAPPPVAKPRGSAIEFSEPLNAEVATNLNQLTTKKDGLRQLEEDLFKPLQTFSPKSSLDGMIAPPVQAPVRAVVPNKHLRELLDKKKNFGLMAPEDFITGTTAEEIFGVPKYDENGMEKKGSSVLERYYERLGKKRGIPGLGDSSDSDSDGKRDGRSDGAMSAEESEFLKGINSSENDLKKMFGTEDKSSLAPMLKPVLTDFFGLGSTVPSREATEIHRQRMNDYGNLIGLDSLSPPENPLDSASPIRGNSWGDLYTPSRSSIALPPGARPATIYPSAGLPPTIATEPVVQVPLAPLREAPRALPTVLDFPKRKF